MPKTLNDIGNYQKTLSSSIKEILSGFISLLAEYCTFFSDNTNIKKTQYFKYVYLRGIETICSIFKIILLYTKNLDLTVYHCQKSFYYYIEFIGQIGDSNHQFLQLNSKDAALFVLKKTIFEINEDYRKTFETPIGVELEKFNITALSIQYISSLFSYYTDSINTSTIEERNNMIKTHSNNIISVCNNIPVFRTNKSLEKITILNQITDKIIADNNTSYTSTINNDTSDTNNTDIDTPDKLLDVLDVLHNKFLKNNIDLNLINRRIYMPIFKTQYESLSCCKFCSWLLSSNTK